MPPDHDQYGKCAVCGAVRSLDWLVQINGKDYCIPNGSPGSRGNVDHRPEAMTIKPRTARSMGDFGRFRKTTLTEISLFTVPPGTTFRTPEGLHAEDEECRIAFDSQGGVYPIRESVFQATYAPVAETTTEMLRRA